MNEEIREAIFTKVGTVLSGTSVEYENQPFNREGLSEWVRVSILDGTGFNATMGRTKKIKQPGILVCEIFAVRGTGTKATRQTADTIADGFRNVQLSEGSTTVDFINPTMANGDDGDPNYYRQIVNCEFLAQDTKSDAT